MVQPGVSCSIVNESLKSQMAILQIHCYFLLKKCESSLQIAKVTPIFSAKITSVFVIVLLQILNNCNPTMSLILNNWALVVTSYSLIYCFHLQ